jgi:agmatine deiminase
MTFRMPAEWARHQWTWIGFPANPDEWPSAFEGARRQVAGFADALAAGEEVRLVCASEADAAAARGMLSSAVKLVVEPLGDIWLRDTAPIAVMRGAERALADFGFNGWGGKYVMPGDSDLGARLAAKTGLPTATQNWVFEGGAVDTDGTGLFVTTEQCLLNPNRNPELGREKIETLLAGALGLTRMIWLGEGLAGDHTDGHVDNLARFVAPGVLAIPTADREDDPNGGAYVDARRRAEAFEVTVVPLPSPGRVMVDGAVVPASYMNFTIGNAVVIVPQYGVANDAAAVAVLAGYFPGRKVVGLPSDAILAGGGSFHCCSQQMPEGT